MGGCSFDLNMRLLSLNLLAEATFALVLGILWSPSMAQGLEQFTTAVAEPVNADDLLLVQVVHRHGEREALFDIPVAGRQQPSQLEHPKQAQLTAKGVEQMWQYGQFMRRRYHEYFEDGLRSSSQRIKVISSATDRTISSAQALIAGLLPPNGTMRQWNSTLGAYWNPFPIYSRPSAHDSLLLNFKDDCPVFSVLRDNIDTLPVAQQLQAEMKDFIKHVTDVTGITDYKFFATSTAIEDAGHYLSTHPTTNDGSSNFLPAWLDDNMVKGFKRIADLRMHFVVGGNGDRRRTRFRTGNLLHDMFQRMNVSSSATKMLYLKMVFYSGHDENVAAILAALNLYNYTLQGPNMGIPEFTASIIMELHKNNTVRLLLKNNPDRMWEEPVVLLHPECPVQFCPLEKLYALLADVILTEDQWRSECGLQQQQAQSPEPNRPAIGLPESIVIAGTLLALAIIVMSATGLYIFTVHRRSRERI